MKRFYLVFINLFTVAALTATAQTTMNRLEQQAEAIIGKMTLEEKFTQLMNETPGIQRLGIEPYDWWNEGLHGVGRSGRATVFPQPIGLGATFNPAIARQIGDAIATEARAKYVVARRNHNYARYTGLTFWSPNVNIFRDPRWGRGMETWGEDPFLTGTMGTAFVRGMQGDDPVYLKVAACGKHYAVHSGPEATRHEANVTPSQHDLWETYLPAFEMLVKEGRVEIIMGAYNRVYGESASGSKLLLTDILRKKWGFQGHIVSDCDAVADIWKGHKIASTEAEACAIAIKAGLNVECGSTFKALKDALAQNLLTEQDIDHALKPLMMTRLKLGILQPDADCPYNKIGEEQIGSREHIALAHQAAVESMVLLKNENNALPIDKNIHTLFVTGAGAADAFWLMGNYFGISDRYCTYLQGIVSKVSSGTAVNYRPGCMESTPTRNAINWAVDESVGAEKTIVVMGNNGNLEGEEGEAIDSERGDRDNIRIPESQMDYLRKICRRKKSGVIVVLTGGSPLDVREVCQLADAVVMAWYPGQEGGYALADLLFGDANFSGRLPVTFPEDGDLLPAFDDYSMRGRTYKYMEGNIYFPFGFGLSYGHVGYSDLKVNADKKQGASVTFTLQNDSKCDVVETPQVYVSAPGAGTTAPLQQLAAFRRVEVKAGERITITIDVPVERLMTVQADGTRKLVKGEYTLLVGSAAPSPRSSVLGVSCVSAKVKL
ncbi:MAG: glycoside hydrolase family 3 C-terminal domain-containing protein [Prevotella sp.]|nr:glycoside hydrolase family 3 C-terminal domain-containing protein [Prevotella sp.]